jgi:hypothetical protein
MAIAPQVTASVVANAVRIQSVTPIGVAQRVRLFLNELNAPANRAPRAYTFDAPAGNGVVAPAVETSVLDIAASGVASGAYLVRISVDGVQSPLMVDVNGAYNQPQVTL